jgi:hypothetical protein
MERACIGCRVEIQIAFTNKLQEVESWGRTERITSKYLVAALAAQDHLDAHSFDLATEEVHRRACSHGGNVIGL